MTDLGFRRRAFRKLEGECEYDFRARKAIEREERKAMVAGRIVWPSRLGPYVKSLHGAKPKHYEGLSKRARRIQRRKGNGEC